MVPTNAEINDIVNTVLDGTDCIYLDVTTRSAHKVHCIEYVSSICRQGEAAIWEQQLFTELSSKVSVNIRLSYLEMSWSPNARPEVVLLKGDEANEAYFTTNHILPYFTRGCQIYMFILHMREHEENLNESFS